MYSPLHRAASSNGGSFLGMSSEEETKWMERRRKVLKKLKAKKMSRRGGTQWMDTASTTTTKRSSGSSATIGSSKRTSVGTEAAASACSWDPTIEQAINVGSMGDEDAIIEEAEEEEQETEAVAAETQPDEGPLDEDSPETQPTQPEEEPVDEGLSETRSQLTPSEVLSDIRSEYGDSFISGGESSATDIDSAGDVHSTVEVSFDDLDYKIGADAGTLSDRSSFSSLGSGYDVVVDHHAVFFGTGDKAVLAVGMAISESSLGSLDWDDLDEVS
ncbi:hypothetical protein K438DRAFT_1809786 [Mycena galopus ATCC 62051]|nr:hypothetical protein K438DRAFT_1809786 [Mycena galopus ATCC 62051]